MPTSLVTNWTAELTKFCPHLRVVVLHGLERHARRGELDGVDVVITTYTVLARDIEEMKRLPWHIVVLDEATGQFSKVAGDEHAAAFSEPRF